MIVGKTDRPFRPFRYRAGFDTFSDLEVPISEAIEDPKEVTRLEMMRNHHYLLEVPYEKEWRAEELARTDKTMFVDSTYNGKRLTVDMKNDMREYRQALRDYNDPSKGRPKPPVWWRG